MDNVIIKKLPNTEAIIMALIKNDGYCPCKAVKNESTKCMCEEFRNQPSGECNCGLYVKIVPQFVLYTKEGCPRCKILKEELDSRHVTYLELTEYPENVTNLPVLVSPMGAEYNYKEAMELFPRRRNI